MEAKYYEDLVVGFTVESMGRTVTEPDVVMFNNIMKIMNPIHSDPEHVRDSMFDGMVAPAPFILTVSLGLLSGTGYLTGSVLGVLEYENLKFLLPVRPGDTLYASVEVVARRETSDGKRGVVSLRDNTTNQRGETVYIGLRKILVRKRSSLGTDADEER